MFMNTMSVMDTGAPGYLDIGPRVHYDIYEEIDGSEFFQGTTAAGATQVIGLIGPIQLNRGDKIRIQGKFSDTDVGSNWLEGKCIVSIRKVRR